MSTGVGGGVISAGRLITGARGFAGELGHVAVVPNGRRCSCGLKGCLEAYCGGQALTRWLRRTTPPSSRIVERAGDERARIGIHTCPGGDQDSTHSADVDYRSLRPDLFGPIIVPGSPLSYWAGIEGQNPMRYTGGLSGGSWITALTSGPWLGPAAASACSTM